MNRERERMEWGNDRANVQKVTGIKSIYPLQYKRIIGQKGGLS